jgi:transcription-repair coupling factor (superfamily II helicase)
LPQDYIPQPEIRLGIYRRLAKAAGRPEVDELREEIADRFGPLPRPVELLLDTHLVRIMAGALDVSAIAAGPQAIAVEFANGQSPDVELDEDLYWKDGRLICRRPGKEASGRLDAVLELLSELG